VVRVTIPAGPEALDAAWLEATLRRGAFPGARVRGVSREIIGAGFGFVSVLARLTLDGDGVPRTVVAKCCRANEATIEARFARDVALRIDVDCADVLAFAADETSGRAVLLLADVAAARQGDSLVGAGPAEAAALVDAMARFHSTFWNATDDAAVSWLRRWGDGHEEREARTAAAVPRFLDVWGARLSSAERAATEALPRTLPGAYAALRSAPATLVHGDLHLDNVMFRADGRAVVLDWTDAARGPVAADLVRLLVDGLPEGDRRADVRRRLVERYVAETTSRGVRGLDADGVLADVGRAATVALAAEVRAVARRVDGRGDPLPDHPRVPLVVDREIRAVAAAAAETWSA
jgi:hypothetical protein